MSVSFGDFSSICSTLDQITLNEEMEVQITVSKKTHDMCCSTKHVCVDCLFYTFDMFILYLYIYIFIYLLYLYISYISRFMTFMVDFCSYDRSQNLQVLNLADLRGQDPKVFQTLQAWGGG